MDKQIITKIYVDMDGVIADFESRYECMFGMKPRQAEKNKKFDVYFREFISSGQFATLEPMSDARKLIDYLDTLPVPKEILSSTARPEFEEDISHQKLVWLQTHGITWKPNFVPGKKHKYKWATETSLIIDDTFSVIDDWRKSGGQAIWYTDFDHALPLLESYKYENVVSK